jgi:hypothetical protein
MKNIVKDVILRSDSPGYEHRSWKVIKTSWDREGQQCVVQNNVGVMESKPCITTVKYLITYISDNGDVYPSIREAVQLVMSGGKNKLTVDNETQTLDEWKANQKEAIDKIKSLAKWES